MRQIASPLALLDSGPPRPYSLFVSHRARSLLDTATKLNTRLQPHGRTPLQMVTLIWKIIPLHRCTVAEIGGCSIFNRLCSCGQSVEIATLPWKIGNAHPNQPSNALHCELNQIAQIFHGQGVFQCVGASAVYQSFRISIQADFFSKTNYFCTLESTTFNSLTQLDQYLEMENIWSGGKFAGHTHCGKSTSFF